MSDHLHTVTIAGAEDSPEIEFTCHGGQHSLCHLYPDCDCESWGADHEHPAVVHDECWLKSWFDMLVTEVGRDYGPVCPMPADLGDEGYQVGMSGPIIAYFDGEVVHWEFDSEAVQR